MPLIRKRRAPVADDDEEEAPVASRPQSTIRRRHSPPASDHEDEEYANGDGDATPSDTNLDQMVKNMVRLALACENPRQFKAVFDGAQLQLRARFGMEMVELPMKEKVTVAQRRAAQKSEKASTTSKAYILTTTLPAKFRLPLTASPPPATSSSTSEAAYTALYTFIIALILLSGGSLPAAKLDRYLKRTNADEHTPVDGFEKTEKLLARMGREGYVVKVRENAGGEDMVEWMVGPRGRVEVGEQGVGGLVRAVYGGGEEGDVADLEKRLQRSLGVVSEQRRAVPAPATGTPAAAPRKRGRPRKETDEEAEERLDRSEEEFDDDDDDD
ncbi:hypothetical protein B0A49_06821 [Cryomyces minteri]|uniref:MAGE domain-containing protein n=1 Tax=Cryomyces minteri TaxID=331657 RepID=A0A4U0WY42_9PEZI|nr:hypothetical protein B0A49_06821 [Cryomyces minteri]